MVAPVSYPAAFRRGSVFLLTGAAYGGEGFSLRAAICLHGVGREHATCGVDHAATTVASLSFVRQKPG
jgi:hypothetical protein